MFPSYSIRLFKLKISNSIINLANLNIYMFCHLPDNTVKAKEGPQEP
jgi:hypothetical protein